MIDSSKPIYISQDGESYYLIINGWERRITKENINEWEETKTYLKEHPKALVPEPQPPAPTPEQLAEREIAEKLAYLASTDWYVIRFADSGVAVPDDIKAARAQARSRIDELKGAIV